MSMILQFPFPFPSVAMKRRQSWNVGVSDFAQNTFNPIRAIVDCMDLQPNPDKKIIALSIGDPTKFGNFQPPCELRAATKQALKSDRYYGYAPSTGHEEARQAVADYCSTEESPLEAKDVILCSGGSHAIDLCITTLANPGQNILVPRPGFSLYRTLAEGLGITCKSYNLLPEKNWEIDLNHLESLIDSNTCAIVANNPSNPCGSVYTKRHLTDLLQVAERNYVVIIADEIYDYFVFSGHTFYPLATLTTEVPILTCGGLTKRYMVPGWRMGWILIHDRNDVLNREVRKGLTNLSQRIIGSNTLVQGALPAILANTPRSFLEECIAIVETNALTAYALLIAIPGLRPVMPQGAMYMMIALDSCKFPEFNDELEFLTGLMAEQSVFCLPGQCFDYPHYFRIVLTVPEDLLREAITRIREFCERHYRVTMALSPVETATVTEKSKLNGEAHAIPTENAAGCPAAS